MTNSAKTPTARAIFTIVSANYIAFAATLMQSVREQHPTIPRYIFLSDAMHDFAGVDLAADVIPCDALGIPNIENMKLWYTVIEFNTAIKPYCFLHLFDDLGCDEVCYLDPDIRLFQPMREVFWALRDHSCVLTPHMMRPLQDGKLPSDLSIMKSGVYNLGFLGLKNDDDGRHLARWWADRCYDECRVDIAGHRFTDQRWMDLAPAFVARPHILRHPGYNVAYWNLAHRHVMFDELAGWTANGEPLVFFHFSGINLENDKVFSKHQNRFDASNLGEVAELCRQYRSAVLGNGWRRYSATPYAFGTFANGRPIEDEMRAWLIRNIEEGNIDKSQNLHIDSDYFDRADEFALAKGAKLTRFMHQTWLNRRDLREAFDIFRADGLDKYYEWFLHDEQTRNRADPRSLSAAASLRFAEAPAPTWRRRAPPWPSVAESCWDGAARNVSAFLAADVVVDFGDEAMKIQRLAALTWEMRPDLMQHFRLDSVESLKSYLAWCLTEGCLEGAMDAARLSHEAVAELCEVSELTKFYGEAPLTEGMLITRKCAARRTLTGWERFPTDRRSRAVHGLWYAFIAPAAFGWPEALVAPVKAYFRDPSPVGADGLHLSRGALAVWEARSDLQATFPLTDAASFKAYLVWLANTGLKEIGVAFDDLDPALAEKLGAPSARYGDTPLWLELVYAERADVRESFDMSTPAGRRALVEWAHAAGEYPVASWRPISAAPPPVRPMSVEILLTGEWSKPSGRGEDVRGSAAALRAQGFFDFLVFDPETQSFFDPEGDPVEAAAGVACAVNICHTNADMALTFWRVMARAKISAARTIGYWAWELDALPSYWRHAFGFYDEIWAATRFADGAFARELLRPVSIMPLAVIPPEVDALISRTQLGLAEDETIFVSMFDFRSYASRKNPHAVLAAFVKAFPDRAEKVRLIMKTKGGESDGDAWRRLNAAASDARIEIRDIAMPRDRLLSLIARSDAFVSLHRSEGFGRGPAEAMLLGVPTILTDYSGTADFATPDCALPVAYRLVRVEEGEYPGVEGQSWADADIDAAAERIRWVHENRDAARALGARGRERIAKRYAPRVVGARMLAALGLRSVIEA